MYGAPHSPSKGLEESKEELSYNGPAKQRGLYSEYLGKSSKVARNDASSGINGGGSKIHQRVPRARNFSRGSPKSRQSKQALALHQLRVGLKPAVEPKTVVPYKQVTGLPPRRIEIERKKRLYASQDIDEMLVGEGVDYNKFGLDVDHVTGQPSYLSLEIFDDTEFEARDPKDWIRLGTNEGATAIAAKALRFDDSGSGSFQPCSVTGFNEDTEKFDVLWGNGDTTSLFRIHVTFLSENPLDFVRRVSLAHKSRREFEATIRYSLYVDSMPTDEIEPLDPEQVNRVLLLALNTEKLKSKALDTSSLLSEVIMDYARTMNKIIFDVNLKDPNQLKLQDLAALPPQDIRPKEAKWSGVVKVPSHDFPKHFSDFCFHSFSTKLEAITALIKTNAECQRLSDMCLFNVNISKTIRLEEFDQLQSTNLSQLKSFLKDKWTLNLKTAIKSSLKEVGKGWFNLNEKNREVYMFSKLKKFMMMINFLMQDSLRFLVMDSLDKYKTFIHDVTRFKVTVHGTSDVHVTTHDEAAKAEKEVSAIIEKLETEAEEKEEEVDPDVMADLEERKLGPHLVRPVGRDFPLLSVDLVVREGRIQFTTNPQQIIDTPLACFDKALFALHDIPQLETSVMEQLFWYGNESRLASVQRQEKWVEDIFVNIKSQMEDAVKPMHEYAEQFQVYNEVLTINPDAYVKQFVEEDVELDEFRKEIKRIKAKKAEIDKAIPKQIWLGPFMVNCSDVRSKLSQRYHEMLQKLLNSFAQQTRSRCDEVQQSFKKIEVELKAAPVDISQLVKMKEYMKQVPLMVKENQSLVQEVLDSFEVLDEFQFRPNRDLIRMEWVAYSWPKVINDHMAAKEQLLEKERGSFFTELKTNQDKFNGELVDLEKKINTFGQHSDIEKVGKIADKCVELKEQLDDMQTRSREFNNKEGLFEQQSTDYRHVQKLAKAFDPYFNLWTTSNKWLTNHEDWMKDSFMNLDGDQIMSDVTGYIKLVNKTVKVKTIKDNEGCAAVGAVIQKEMGEFKPLLPMIAAMRNPGMRDRHWESLSKELPFEFKIDESLTLSKIVDEYKLQDHMEIITKIGETAGKEFQIESVLDKMEEAWKGVSFEVKDYKATGTYVVRGTEEVIQQLDEHIVMTQAMQFSAFKGPFEERINKWATKMNTVSEVIEEWLAVQRQWLSLQSIFASPDINKQLPAEGKRFAGVNKTWRLIMSQTFNNPDVLTACDSQTLLAKFQDANKLLTMVQKRLSDYLDKKRAAFARFYFLSNDELLQILSQTQDPTAVQPHLKKCFENMYRLEFNEENEMVAMFSSTNERVPFTKKRDPKNKSVEYWLGEVEDEMKITMKDFMERSVADYNQIERIDWVRKWPGQCVLNGSQIHWTMEVEEALKNGGLEGIKAYATKSREQLTNLVNMIRGDLTKVHRLICNALIVLDVHARDVVEGRLIEEECTTPQDFAWICQMRYYQEDEGLWVQMVQSRFPYGYEYLGNSLRLVITPLTDRCYMTLMAALSLNLGGAPAGPAGTGKTETVKDLAKCVAKQCVVFNCSDGLNYLAMGKFFKGLASSGAWACFDEFNRIDIEVLSVVAQQIMTIWNAIRAGLKTFVFEETELRLEPTCSVFITMNPGYAGRTELPDNLAALFRPVAMMVPDYAMIAEIEMSSYGIVDAKNLGRKMVATFKLCSEQLSSQSHYDYGMRAVKTVITRAGILKRADPEGNEDVLLLRALRDVNVPKFLSMDLPLFEGIISDLFPGVKRPEINYGPLMNSIIVSAVELGLQPTDMFLNKCIQLYETTVVRHGLMVVGPTGAGKTSTIRTLQKALTKIKALDNFEKVKINTVNPKAVTMGQLYGESDPNTREWTDGILACIVRECIEDSSPDKKWVIFDGPVDAIWIENMNTVLDDNKKLCLVSGEILQITPSMSMIFEVEDLAVASPATVSRCGMVYEEPESLTLAPLIKSWVEKISPQFQTIAKSLSLLFDQFLEPSLTFMRKQCNEPVPTVNNNLMCSLGRLLDAMMAPMLWGEAASNSEIDEKVEQQKVFKSHIEAMFLSALVWSVGASVDGKGRKRFSNFLRLLIEEYDISEPFPEEGLVYDYVFNLEQAAWVPWMTTVDAFKADSRLSFSELIVPTEDSVRYTYYLKMLIENKSHVLFTGETGTGKTVNINQYLGHGLSENLSPVNIMFSAATSANQLEDMLFEKMTKRRQRVYGPPLGKRFVIFVDDLNMPAREKYFAQPPIELLRQWMDHGGWYNRTALQFCEILDINFIGALGPPGGGRNPVTPRFFRHFNQIAHTELNDGSLFNIFSAIMRSSMDGKFEAELLELVDNMTYASIKVYRTVCSDLLPTPAKTHYTFNLRDLSKVFQGILSVNTRKCKTKDVFTRLWIHENQRVYKDRLINNEDRQWFDELVGKSMTEKMEMTWEDVVGEREILFGDYMEGMASGEVRNYDEVSSSKEAATVMEGCLAEHNEENPAMKLVMFKDAVGHVSRIARVLRQPGGNALCLGVGGSGRQSLTRLSAYMADMELFQVQVTKTYGLTEWREDIKIMLLKAGLKEQPTVFLFNDTQITREAFLEDVNNILNSGDVPNLYSADDMDNIFQVCKIDCQNKNIPATALNAYAQFIGRVKANLHIVMCMSPMSNMFRTRLRMFPALVNCCTIDWFTDWPTSALVSVANTALTEEDYGLKNQGAVVQMFGFIHESVSAKSKLYAEKDRRYNYTTPTSYLELLNVFRTILTEKRGEVGGTKTKLQNGLNTLAAAKRDVATLQHDLTAKQPVLVETQAEVKKTMEQIVIDKAEASVTKEQVEKQEAEANEKATACKTIRDSAQADLDVALPMLDKAVESLKELNKAHLDEVRNFKKPPGGVVLTMEAAVLMLEKPLKIKMVTKADPNNIGKKVVDYWDTAQKFLLKNAKVMLDSLKAYDKDNIPDKLIAKIKPYVENPDFQVKVIEKVSKACRAICLWVHAMFNYSGVAKTVEPKRQLLKQSEAELAIVQGKLNEAKAKLQAVENKLKALNEGYEASVAKAQALEDEVETCKAKLIRADKLIGGLGGEETRWKQTVAALTVQYDNLEGDVLVSCGTVAYLGAFTSEYRKTLTGMWRSELKKLGVAYSENCTVQTTLADPVQIRAWNIAGLPTDSSSTENGIIMSKARRWPLLIDPQGQAAKFIKNMGDQKFEEGMTVIKQSDKNFILSMENSIRFGKWVMIEAVLEELDPALEPVLLQQVVKVNGAPMMKVGENQVPYNDGFHLYLASKLPNPHYPPELQVKVTLLNFTITLSGLKDQMLGTVVGQEAPELEQKKNTLVVENARMKKQLQDVESNILKLLSEVSGDILDDEELIEVLAESKKTSTEINVRVAESEVVEKEIDESRTGYIPVAERAALLYFCIADLANIDSMYQFSLQWFVQLFIKGVSEAEPTEDLTKRLNNINVTFTKMLYENVCRSLFEIHKSLFSFLLAVRILKQKGEIDDSEWRFLIAGGAPTSPKPNPAPSWCTNVTWSDVQALAEVCSNFKGFDETFVKELPKFKAMFDSPEPHLVQLPEPWQSKLTSFQKILVLKCVRSDKVTQAVDLFIREKLGAEFTEPPQFNLPLSYKDSSSVSPLIFVLSSGADPAAALLAFANDMGFRDKLNQVSLGQGQGGIASRFIDEAQRRGGWVMLQNCHLAVSWLPTLEQICADTKAEEVHEDYRLWLTSKPSAAFPVSVLQNGVKMTNEPPKGLKANMQRSYTAFTDAEMNRCTKPKEFKKLLFSICFFHAVILDRRKFGPLGWNIPYEFTEGDLEVCITQLREFIDMYDEVPYKVIHFLTYDINYGGRVTDDKDRRTIMTILDDFVNANVISDDYKFCPSGRYKSVETGTREDYLKYITTMSAVPEPEVFGMHGNADITSAQQQTQKMLATILTILPRSSSGGGKSRDVVLAETAAAILAKTPHQWELESVSKNFPTLYSESMNTVLLQEAARFNKLIGIMRKTLVDLQRALKGEVVLSTQLEEMGDSLFTNMVPEMWNEVSYPSLMPLAAWVDDLNARIAFLQNWIDTGTPKAFWISGFFFPQAFLTGTLQNYARKYTKPIDTVAFSFKMMKKSVNDIKARPEDGVYVYGMYLQGARWDSAQGTLSDSRPKELFSEFPLCWLVPEVHRKKPTSGIYDCPVYKTLTRAGTLSTTGHSTNFVVWLEVPTRDAQQKWIKAGVALFCALNYIF